MTAKTTPTFPQMQHFFRLVDEGKITAERFQAFLENPNRFFEETGFPVTVDYDMPLDAMIDAGKYDWKNDDITVEHFPIEGTGTVECKLLLVHLDRSFTTAEVEEQLKAQGLEPAKIEHLLAFGAKYPEKQLKFPIIALGSSWVDSDGDRYVPYLSRDGSKRRLRLGWDRPDRTWSDDCRFLAVSK